MIWVLSDDTGKQHFFILMVIKSGQFEWENNVVMSVNQGNSCKYMAEHAGCETMTAIMILLFGSHEDKLFWAILVHFQLFCDERMHMAFFNQDMKKRKGFFFRKNVIV